jgi:hypothetical protein
MDKRCGNQDTGTEVFAEEEDWRWDLHPLDFLCYDWKSSTSNRSSKDDDCVAAVRRQHLSIIGNTYRLQLRATGSHSLQNLHHCHTLASP